MKKKTTALAVASLLLAGAMCMSFASCGDGEETAESMTGEEVTKAQWEAAFGEENFKNVKIEICILEETDEGKTKNEQEIVVQDGKTYFKLVYNIERGGDSAEELPSFEGEKTEEYTSAGTLYRKVNDAWMTEDGVGGSVAIGHIQEILERKELYDDWIYDADKKGYVQNPEKEHSPEDFTYGKIVFKFKDGKLAAIWGAYEEEYEEGKYVHYSLSELYAYGGQSVTLPEIG